MLSFSLSPSTYISLQCTLVAHNRGTSPRISPARLPLSMCRKAQLRLRQLRQSSSGDAENKVDAENQVVPAWVIQCNVIHKVIGALKERFFFNGKFKYTIHYTVVDVHCHVMQLPNHSLSLSLSPPEFLVFLFKKSAIFITVPALQAQRQHVKPTMSHDRKSQKNLGLPSSALRLYPKNQNVALWNTSDGDCGFWLRLCNTPHIWG